jgi:hypothetical protein
MDFDSMFFYSSSNIDHNEDSDANENATCNEQMTFDATNLPF